MLQDLILKNRSFRRFHQEIPIQREMLLKWIDLARLSASARNAQPLKFYLSCTRETNDQIFPYLAWAGFLTQWSGPSPGEQPTAYIVILGDHQVSDQFFVDHGIAAQSILLGAVEDGFGGCMIMAIRKKELALQLELQESLEILMVIALGKPAETVVIEPLGPSTHYWRDENQIHHVPKRYLTDIILP